MKSAFERSAWQSGILLILVALACSGLSIWNFSSPQGKLELKAFSHLEAPSGANLLVLGRKISIHQASARDLMALPGVGPERARQIVRWREQHGPFPSIEALQAVPGIGPHLMERIGKHLTLGTGTP